MQVRPLNRSLALLLVAVALTACSTATSERQRTRSPSGNDPAEPATSVRLRHEVLAEYPHDQRAFTQGLEIQDGVLYESTGLRGRSTVRRYRFDGEPGPQLRSRMLPDTLFGEGLTVTSDALWQLTWQAGIAIERDPQTLRERARRRYSGEGWGICSLPGRLVTSDGSATLTFRSPEDFRATATVQVREEGRELSELNELECAPDGSIWANVFQTDRIVRIDPDSGAVTGYLDLEGLLPARLAGGADVLNGIALLPSSSPTQPRMLVTGKLWPRSYLLRVE